MTTYVHVKCSIIHRCLICSPILTAGLVQTLHGGSYGLRLPLFSRIIRLVRTVTGKRAYPNLNASTKNIVVPRVKMKTEVPIPTSGRQFLSSGACRVSLELSDPRPLEDHVGYLDTKSDKSTWLPTDTSHSPNTLGVLPYPPSI